VPVKKKTNKIQRN